MLHAPMDYLDCACFTGRTSIPIRCIVERVSPLVSNNLTSPSSPTSPPTNVSSNSTTPPVTITTPPTSLLPLSSSSLLSPTSNLTTTTTATITVTTNSTTTTTTTTSSLTTHSVTHSTTTTTTTSPSSSTLTCLPIFPINCGGSSIGSTSCNPNANLTTHELISDGTTIDSKTDPLAITSSSSSSSSLSSVTQSVNCFNTINKTLSPSLISKENLITPTTSSSLSSAGDKNSGEGGCTVGSESVAELKSVNSTSTSNCNNIVDENIDVNPANLTNSNNNCNLDENNINNNNNNTSGSVNVTGNITSNGDSCVNLTIGEKSINNNTRSPDNNNTSNSPNNQRQLNISPLQDLSNKINSESISVGQLSPTSTLRNLFGLNNNPFQLNHLNLNQSPLNYLNHNNHHHHHHHHLHHHSNLLSTNFEHSSTLNQQQQSNGDSSPGNSGSSRTFPASISPSGVVEQDSFAIITSGILFSNLVKTALLHLGYSTSEITGAKGFIQLRNWKPLTLDQITDSVDATVGDIMGDISSIASLRIILSKPRTSGPNEIEDKLLQVLLAQSYSLLANSGNPVDQSLLAALIGRNNRSGLEAELNEETRGKFDQWYMQQVFNQYRQMATLAAAQAHHQQAAAAAAAVMAATSQQQKHQAAAAALAAAVNAAAASAGAGGGSGGSVDGSVTDRNRGAAAAAAAAAAAVAAAANCQSLLNLDLDASSLASSASASGHSNHLKDNHHHHPSKHHQQQHEHHHSRGPSLASSSSSHLPLISTGRSSDSSSGERGGGIAGDRIKSEGINLSSSNNSSSGSTNSNNNLNNSSKDNGNNNSSNRTSPNAPGQYVRTRIRTSFDPEMELPKLHKWFSENQHPTRPQIQQFVKELNSLESRRGRKPLDVNNVVYWFKNARAAHKRHELKLVNGSQSPTLSNNNGNNNSTNNSSNLLNSGLPSHLRDPFDGRLGLGSRSRLSAGLIPGLIGDRMGGMGSLGSGRGGNGNGGESESYPDSNGNEDLLGQMYDDEGSDGGDYDGDDMMMDDDCSSQISQTLDLSVRPVKRQRSDSSPPGSPISGPSSLSDLIRGTPPHTVASASSCHSNFNVKDEPPSDEDDDDYDDDMDERDYYPVATGRHGLNLQQVNSSISGRSSGDAHNLSSGANYLGSDGINGGIGDLSSGRHHSSSSSSHERHHQSSSNLNNGGSHGQPDSPEEGRRARRSRTFIDPTTEVPKLEQWFHQCTHPTHPQIVQYTDELNSSPYRLKYPKLEPKNIQFWFKNRRAKSKRQNVPMSSSNTSPLASTATGSTGTSGGPNNNPPSSSSSSSSTSGPLAPVTTTTTSSSSSSSLSPSLASNCSVSSLSLATSTGPVSTSVSSSALTIDRLIGH